MGEADEFGVMQRGPMENLFFVPSGRLVSSPAELVASTMKLVGTYRFPEPGMLTLVTASAAMGQS